MGEQLLRNVDVPRTDDSLQQALAQRRQIESRRRPASDFQRVSTDANGNKRVRWDDRLGGEAAFKQQDEAVSQALKEFDGGPLGAIIKNSANASGMAIGQTQEKIDYHKEPLGMATYFAKEAAPWVGGIPLGMLETYGIRKGIGLGPGSSTTAKVGSVLGGLGLSGFEYGLARRADEHSKDQTLTPFMQDTSEGLANLGYGAAGMNAVGAMISPFIGTGATPDQAGNGGNSISGKLTAALQAAPAPEAGVNGAAAHPPALAGPKAPDYQAIAKQLGGGVFDTRDEAKAFVENRVKAGLKPAEAAAVRSELAPWLPKANSTFTNAMKKAPVVGALVGGAALLADPGSAEASSMGEDSSAPFKTAGRLGEALLNAGSYALPVVGTARTVADMPSLYTPSNEDMADSEYWSQGIVEMEKQRRLADALKAGPQAAPTPPTPPAVPQDTDLKKRLYNSLLGYNTQQMGGL